MKYRTKAFIPPLVYDDEAPYSEFRTISVEASDDAIETGLLDASGTPLYRVKDTVGFHNFGEER